MKIKYIGLAPMTNIYGDWKNGDIKIVSDKSGLDKQIGFERLDKNIIKSKPQKIITRKKKEKLQDKMDRENKNFYE